MIAHLLALAVGSDTLIQVLYPPASDVGLALEAKQASLSSLRGSSTPQLILTLAGHESGLHPTDDSCVRWAIGVFAFASSNQTDWQSHSEVTIVFHTRTAMQATEVQFLPLGVCSHHGSKPRHEP